MPGLGKSGTVRTRSFSGSQSMGFFAAAASAMVTAGTVSGPTNSFEIGTLRYTVTALNPGSTQINFRPRTVIGALWSEVGGDSTGGYFAGAPITLNYGRTVGFASASQSVGEDVGTTTITAQLSGAWTADVTVPFTVLGAGADGGGQGARLRTVMSDGALRG